MVLPQAMAWVQYWFRVLSLKFCGKSKKICGDISPVSPAFLMYASKHLHKWMHNHIGCICLTFFQCAFSNVSSNGLPEQNQSHIDCISLTFSYCAFSNVSSKLLHKRMHNHIGYMYFHLTCINISSRQTGEQCNVFWSVDQCQAWSYQKSQERRRAHSWEMQRYYFYWLEIHGQELYTSRNGIWWFKTNWETLWKCDRSQSCSSGSRGWADICTPIAMQYRYLQRKFWRNCTALQWGPIVM